MTIRRDVRGYTLVELLVAIPIITIALVALLSMLSRGALNVYVGGGQSKATAYARQLLEQIKNQPLNAPCNPPAPLTGCFPPANGTDTPEPGVVRTWTVTPTGTTVAPNRLWTVTMTVRVNNAQTVGGENITVWTMRAECGTGAGQYAC